MKKYVYLIQSAENHEVIQFGLYTIKDVKTLAKELSLETGEQMFVYKHIFTTEVLTDGEVVIQK